MQRAVSVIIPNYNGKHLLKAYLPSVIAALNHSRCEYEVIVSDDASTDGTAEMLHKDFPEIKIIQTEVNSGFSRTANRGINAAKHPLVLLLNSDVSLKEDYLDSQWKYFDDPNTFGVMGSIWSENGKKLMDAAKYPLWKGGQLKSTLNYQLNPIASCFTLFLSGANALMDRKKLIELGGFDERYSPFYMEDVDLSVRAWRMGWKCIYEPQAVCYHKLSETISNMTTQKQVKMISKRNKFIFHHEHLEGNKRLLWNMENFLNLALRWILMDGDYYKAYTAYRKIVAGKKIQTHYFLSLESVTQCILASLKGKSIVRF